ncbi:uncharacterized protein LOC143021727, partial [Oratosquilla oratoria]|uniref:uncharacterized protein LOC143021727 n=1 Tax=Oratosquilla oratoria TaxID=337810 RepID=UPI003F76EBB2
QDLFGELGSGFIKKCLQYYNYSSEEVINALLEDNLPESLASLDRTLKEEEPKIEPKGEELKEEIKEVKELETKVVTEEDYLDRANVYDDDEFDVFRTKIVDHSKIHKGKKTQQYQPDKDHLERIKEIARKYDEKGGTSVYEDELRIPVVGLDYEDEYDDTYDDNEAGNIDEVGTDNNPKRLNITPWSQSINNPNHNLEEVEVEEEEEMESQPEQGRPKLSFRSFCENPEVVRQRAAERRAARRGGGGSWRGGGGRGGGGGGGGGGGWKNGPSGDDRQADSRFRGEDSSRGARPKVSMKSNKSSGKAWRQGTTGDNDDNSRSHGGKYKESSGRGQSQQYKYKMMHKNDHRRQGAQAKFDRNNRD